MAEPFTGTESGEHTKRQAAERRQLVQDYKALFSTDRGKRVWADLCKKFGFGRWPATDTEDTEKIVRRVFMHGPLHHIEDMRRITFRENTDKPKRALAGNHHEDKTPSSA